MNSFVMNGIFWRVETVDPGSPYLIDRTNDYKLATTDPNTFCVYLSSAIPLNKRKHVLIHELGHCVMISYNLIEDIHQMVKPEYWIDMEEWVCNFLADYGMMIFSDVEHIMGDYAIHIVPVEMERLVA